MKLDRIKKWIEKFLSQLSKIVVEAVLIDLKIVEKFLKLMVFLEWYDLSLKHLKILISVSEIKMTTILVTIFWNFTIF